MLKCSWRYCSVGIAKAGYQILPLTNRPARCSRKLRPLKRSNLGKLAYWSLARTVAGAKLIKNAIVRDQTRLRKMHRGLCRGCYVPINLRTHFRWPLGLYETEIRRWFTGFVISGAVCYDVGAAEGYYSVGCAKIAGPAGRVIAFEPDANAYSLLVQTISANANPALSPIKPFKTFLGAGEGSLKEMSSIDHLVFESHLPAPDFLKIDVEGAELAVLVGAERVVTDRAPNMIIEVHSLELEEQCVAWLRRHAYQVTVVSQQRLLPEYRPLLHNRWICATRPGDSSQMPGPPARTTGNGRFRGL
jgi:precorrin-6B methylase 2